MPEQSLTLEQTLAQVDAIMLMLMQVYPGAQSSIDAQATLSPLVPTFSQLVSSLIVVVLP